MTTTSSLNSPAFTASLPDVDVVVNCAAVQYVTKDIPLLFRKSFFERNNVLAANNLCERYRVQAPHFIHVGTSMMYRQTGQDQYDVRSTLCGEGVYSRSKMAAQACIDQVNRSRRVAMKLINGRSD